MSEILWPFLIGLAIPIIAGLLFRHYILTLLKGRTWNRVFLVFKLLLMLIIGWMVSTLKPWEQTQQQPVGNAAVVLNTPVTTTSSSTNAPANTANPAVSPSVPYDMKFIRMLIGALVGLAVVIEFGLDFVKISIADERDSIKKQLEETKKESDAFKTQRDNYVHLVAYLGTIVDAKLTRIQTVLGKKTKARLTPHQLVEAYDPVLQIKTIVAIMHKFFQKDSAPDEIVKVGIYRNLANQNYLHDEYYFDGKQKLSVDDRIKKLLKVGHPNGAKLEIVKVLHLDGSINIKVIENCPEEAKTQTEDGAKGFQYAYLDQEKDLKSLIVFKFQHTKNEFEALLISVESSSAQRYKKENKEIYKTFLTEIAKRLELELANCKLCGTNGSAANP